MTRDPRPIGAPLLLVLGALGLGACGSGSDAPRTPSVPAPPTAPAPPPPPIPDVTVSFPAERIELTEGESALIEVHYTARHLTVPWEFRLAVKDHETPPEDFVLQDGVITIPPGESEDAVSGAAFLTVEALEDDQFAEGEETFLLEPVPVVEAGEVAEIEFEPLPLAIADVAVSPCSGITLSALPWELVESSEGFRPPMPATTLIIEITGEGPGPWFDLLGPYATWVPESRELQPYATFGINRWDVEYIPGGLLHRLEINWPGEFGFAEPQNLEFAFGGGLCLDEPVASCSSTGCTLIP